MSYEEAGRLPPVCENSPPLLGLPPRRYQGREERVLLQLLQDLLPPEGELRPERERLFPALHHLMKPEVVHLRHPQESVGVRHRRGIKDVRVELLVQYQTDHIVKHRGLFEGGVRRRDLDEGLDVNRNVGELQELNQPLPYLCLVPLDRGGYVGLFRVEGPSPLDLLDSLLSEVLPAETRKAVDGIRRGDEDLLSPLLC